MQTLFTEDGCLSHRSVYKYTGLSILMVILKIYHFISKTRYKGKPEEETPLQKSLIFFCEGQHIY